MHRLTTSYVEYLHDDVVPVEMAYDEPVEPEKFKDLKLLDSAVNRPYITFGGDYLYESIFRKAAALFHSLVCNHCFYNGNKRTAVVAVDSFLTTNEVFLAMSNEDMYQLALATASANESGITPSAVLDSITSQLEQNAISLEMLRMTANNHPENPTVVSLSERAPTWVARVREHPRNHYSL